MQWRQCFWSGTYFSTLSWWKSKIEPIGNSIGIPIIIKRISFPNFKNGKITDKGKLFNTEIYEILELRNMLSMAKIIANGALNRKESRGGHYRTDYPKRDDENFLKHSLTYKTDEGMEIKYKPVVITKHQPAERTY